MDPIQVEIIALSTSPSTGGAYSLVLSEVDGARRLPIIIGAFEAQAIAFGLEQMRSPRPMTHDLLRDAFDSLGASVTEVVIEELREGIFYAKIRYTHDGEEGVLDARPSDAIALAVRTEAPIFVSLAVMEEAGLVSDGDEPSADTPDVPEAPPADRPEPRASRSSSRGTPTSSRSGTDRLDTLQSQLQAAIEQEDYEKAARLRDELTRLRGEGN